MIIASICSSRFLDIRISTCLAKVKQQCMYLDRNVLVIQQNLMSQIPSHFQICLEQLTVAFGINYCMGNNFCGI